MMRVRTMVSALLALTLVAGVVTAPPTFAEEPPIVGELPGEGERGEDDGSGEGDGSEGDGSGSAGGDAADGAAGEGAADGAADGAAGDGSAGGFGPMAFGDPVPVTMTPIPLPQRLERSFDFDEPSALFAVQDFPLPDQDTLDDWADRGVTPQQRPMEVRSVVAADLNGDGLDDIVSLVNIRWPDTGISLRAPGRAFTQEVAVAEPDPGLGGWYVVVHLNSEVGIVGGMAYLVTEADSSFIAAIAVGDVTATDGRAAPDIVYTNHQSGEVLALVNDGEGVFDTAISTAIMTQLDRGITLGDITGDTFLDFVASSRESSAGTIIIASGDGAGGFVPEARWEYRSPANIALIDADGSGRPEILTTSFDTGTSAALWRWAQPDGADTETSNGWAIATDAGDLSSTKAAAAWVGDFDGDADQDVALLLRECFEDAAPYCLLPLRNTGGGFTALSAVAVPEVSPYGNSFSSIGFPALDGSTVDVNGDGRPDIVIPGGGGEVAVLLADGSGSFDAVQVYAGTAGWQPTVAGGWDNTADEHANGMWPAEWGTSYQTKAVVAADVTGDGGIDLIVATGSGSSSMGDAPGQLAVVSGKGGGMFVSATAQAVSDTWRQPDFRRDWITTARWNSDIYDDLVYLTGADVMVALGKQGGFERETRIGAAPSECVDRYRSRMLVADVNGDHHPDLVCGGSTGFHVLHGDASGGLAAPVSLGTLGAASPHAEGTHLLALADVDGDGRDDLVFSTSVATNQGSYYGLTDIAFGWMRSLESGGFAAPALLVTSANYQGGTVHRTDPDIPFRPAIADFNRDGRADFALAARIKLDSGEDSSEWGRYDLLTFLSDDGTAEPSYQERTQPVYTELWNSHLGLLDTADLNGDYQPDLILTGLENTSRDFKAARRLLLGDGDGSFTVGQRLPTGAAWPGSRVADVNGDGKADLVSPTGYRGVELRAGHGDGTFGAPELFGTPGVALGWVDLVDVNGDGALDVIGSISETVGSTRSDFVVRPNQVAVLVNGGSSTGPGGDTDPPCEPGEEGCDDDGGDPPAPATVNLVADAPVWSGAASLDAITSGTVTVTVRNTGTAATTGTWVDSLWLSADSTWSADDTLLKAIPRGAAIAAGGSVEIGIPVTLAPPHEGTYRLILRADTRGEITETRLDGDGAPAPAEDDNLAVSAEVVFAPPVLDVPANGTAAPGTETTVTGPGAVILIPEIATGTAAVRLTVTGAKVAGFAVRAGKLPSDTAADQRVTGAGSLTLLPGADRYLRIDLGEAETATVAATRLEFGVGSIAPKRVSVGGSVSFVLTGAGLGQVNAAWAIGPDGKEIAATGLTSSSTGLTLTVDLTGQKPGDYDLRVQSASASATLTGAFTAVADRVGSVRTAVLIPSSLRSGTVGEVWITFANDGLTDAVAPILRISSRGAKPTDTSPYPMGSFHVSPEVPWAPVGVIPAGATGRIVIPFQVDAGGPDGLRGFPPDGNQYTFYVEEFGIGSVAPYNAAADFAEELLEIADVGGRTAIALELTARLGETGGSYLAAMHRLRATMEPPTADLDDLRETMFENVAGAFGSGAVHGTLVRAGAPVADRGLRIEVPGAGGGAARTIEARADETGAWSARGLESAASATVHVDGYGPGPVAAPTGLTAGASLQIDLPEWAALSGIVTGRDGRFAPNAVVTVQSSDGTRWVRGVTDADGVYRFDGIAPGTYRLVAVGMDGGLAITDLTMGAEPTAKNLTLRSTDLAAEGGRVTGALPPMPITELPADLDLPREVAIWVDDDAGLRPVEIEIDGSFAVVGTPGTAATLWLFDAFYGVRSTTVAFPAAGATVGVEWATGGRTVAIPVTLGADDELPQVYMQPAATADRVPVPGGDAGLLLIPSGLAGDPVTWTGATSAGDEGTLSIANVPPGDYRVTVVDSDGGDIAEFPVAASDVTVTFGPRPTPMTASGTAMSGGATIDGGFVELVSTDLVPARRYVTATGDPAADPPTTPGVWSMTVATGTYAVTYYDAAGSVVATGTFPGGLPVRGAGRAFANAPAAAPVAHGSSYLSPSSMRTEGDYGPAGGSVAELEATYKAKFDVKTTPTVDPMVAQALAMPYPKQPPPDECKMLDYSWLAAAKVAASRAEAARKLIWELISDTAKTRNWMLGEAALRAVMFLGEISNFFLGVVAVKQAVGKAAAAAAAREEAKVLAAQGIKPPAATGIIDLNWQPVLENIQKISALASSIYTNAKAAVTSAEPASAGTVMGMLGEIGNLALDLSKNIGIMATSAAVSLARDVIGPIAAVNNMITQVREAGESYRSAIAQLDTMKAALDQLYVSYDFDLGQAHQAWFDFQTNRFPEITLDSEECKEGGGGDDDDEEPGGPGEDPEDPDGPDGPDGPSGPKEPKKPTGPKPGPKQPVGPSGGRVVAGTDPNEIVGPSGVGEERWLQPGGTLGYRIGFENLGPGTVHPPEGVPLASGPAALVTVNFPLPEGALIDTVELGDFGFGVGDGEVRYLPEVGRTSFEDTAPVSMTVPSVFDGQPDVTLSLLRTARAWIDRTTRTVHWEISLVDAATGLTHSNPAAGFLPPEPGGDDAGAGQGWTTVSFATEVSAAGPIEAQASIVFDTNDAIETNVWTNRLDGAAPTAAVNAAATTVVGQTVTVGLDDAGGSGAGLIDVYRSVDGGPWLPWMYQVAPGAKVLLGAEGQRVELRARAVDRVGNAGGLGAIAATRLVASPSGGGPGPGEGGSSGSSGGADTETLPDNAERIAGSNRYGTAAEIAALYGTADSVIVANGEDHKQGFDALAANYLAGQVDAPIVLTRAGVLPPESLAAICSVLRGSTASTRTIYILGGPDTVSAAVEASLARPCTPALGNVRVARIGGSDRYETAAKIATRHIGPGGDVRATSAGGPRTVFLASGVVNADALAAGAVSAQYGIPVLLTGPNRLPETTKAALAMLKAERVVVLGGADRVSAAVKAQLAALGVSDVVRIAGKNRFETSALIATWAALPVERGGLGHAGGLVALANGVTGFADALAAGPLLAKLGGMLLLTAPATLPESLRRFLAGLSERSLLALGGPKTIMDSVMVTAARAVG